MVVILHGGWVYAGFSVAGVVLCIWIDALRHLLVSWRAYFAWYRTLDRADRAVSFSAYSRRLVRLSDILDRPVESAPEKVRSRYRTNMAWFLAEGAGSAAVFPVFFSVTSAFA
jgi:hypothetical protein